MQLRASRLLYLTSCLLVLSLGPNRLDIQQSPSDPSDGGDVGNLNRQTLLLTVHHARMNGIWLPLSPSSKDTVVMYRMRRFDGVVGAGSPGFVPSQRVNGVKPGFMASALPPIKLRQIRR